MNPLPTLPSQTERVAGLPRVAMVSLGCAKNEADAENMLGLLLAAGYPISQSTEQADLCIVNTCTFIQSATDQSLDQLLALSNAGKQLIVSGCMAERFQEEFLAEFPQVRAVLGTGDIESIVQAVHWATNHDGQRSFIGSAGRRGYIATHGTPRLRLASGVSAYVKLAEGCNHRCAFCIIPSLRGQLQSRSIEDIVAEVQALASEGVQEVVLVSQDSTAYGVDRYRGQWRLADLLRAIASDTDIPWVRLMYSYPGELSRAVLETIGQHESLLNYIDITLQHAHPDTLQRMKRPANPGQAIELIREYLPAAVIRSTFIVGFPGETQAEFACLEEFIAEQQLDRVGVFTYSAEETTPAALLPAQVAPEIKQDRQSRLLTRQAEISARKNQALVGSQQIVLVEREVNGQLYGRSYRDAPEIDGQVIIEQPAQQQPNLIGELVPVTITGVAGTYDLQATVLS